MDNRLLNYKYKIIFLIKLLHVYLPFKCNYSSHIYKKYNLNKKQYLTQKMEKNWLIVETWKNWDFFFLRGSILALRGYVVKTL
jgi:hypothetical protein